MKDKYLHYYVVYVVRATGASIHRGPQGRGPGNNMDWKPHSDWAHDGLDHLRILDFHYPGLFSPYFNPFNASWSKLLLIKEFSAILV